MPDRYGEFSDVFPDDATSEYERGASREAERMLRGAAIDACGLCDEHGQRIGTPWVCDHTNHAAAARRGMDMIRKVMGWN